jgi:hypothetical protein
MTQTMTARRTTLDGAASTLGAGTLLAIAALHVAWAHGSSFPARDRETLARTVLGTEPTAGDPAGDGVPPALACYAVAGALTTAAVLVDGHVPLPEGVRRLGLRTVVGALGARGVLGLAGRTRLAVPVATSPEFVRWDRRAFAPLCLLLAATAARSLHRAA